MTEGQDITTTENIDWAARRAERSAIKAADRRRHWWVWVLAGIAALVVVLGIAEVALTVGRVHPGVTVAGIDAGGRTPRELRTLLGRELPKRASSPVTIAHKDKTWSYGAAEVGLEFDYAASVADAMAVGRKGGALAALSGRWDAWFGGVDVTARPLADEALVAKALDDVASGTDVAPVDAAVKLDGTDAIVEPGTDGVALDRDATADAMLAAFLGKDRTVQAPVVTDAVDVTDAEAEQAAATAERMLSAPVTVTYEKKSWKFSPEKVATWIAFARSDEASKAPDDVVEAETPAAKAADDVTLLPSIDAARAEKTVISTLGTDVGRPAKDAQFKTANGKVTIIPSQTGIGPDLESLAVALTDKLTNGGDDRTVELVTTRTEPKITTKKAQSMGVKERISTYTTTYGSGDKPRVNNIHLLGDSLDGTLIEPGGTFSFNGAIGERTAARGYKEANAIVNGKLVPQLGGGICQVGTTLFNAVFESGLPVAERRNHSFYISHYPKGRDATVSWGGPDLKFKNDTDSWVLISVAYTSSSITISLYGTDPGYEVTSQTGDWTNIVEPPIEELKDATMPAGTKVIEDRGVSGRSITVKRIVQKDGKVVRTDTFVSKYKPKAEVVRVGTKEKVAAGTATTP